MPSTLDTGATFLAEVDAWLIRINEGITELERRHEKHMSVTEKWLKRGGESGFKAASG